MKVERVDDTLPLASRAADVIFRDTYCPGAQTEIRTHAQRERKREHNGADDARTRPRFLCSARLVYSKLRNTRVRAPLRNRRRDTSTKIAFLRRHRVTLCPCHTQVPYRANRRGAEKFGGSVETLRRTPRILRAGRDREREREKRLRRSAAVTIVSASNLYVRACIVDRRKHDGHEESTHELRRIRREERKGEQSMTGQDRRKRRKRRM